METASTGTKTKGGYLRAEGSSPPSRFGTITPTTRRSRVSIASGKDVKGRAHWMRVGAWVRRGSGATHEGSRLGFRAERLIISLAMVLDQVEAQVRE